MNEYYMWLLDRIEVLHGSMSNYQLLMEHLFSTEYTYMFVMDENRAKGGENLRSIFALESGVYLEDVYRGPCTVLEMLIALAEKIAFDRQENTAKWFWEMIDNLGLMECDDDHYDMSYVYERLQIWMDRQYEPSGIGGLFPIPGFQGDMRTMEIWAQKNTYLTSKYRDNNHWS